MLVVLSPVTNKKAKGDTGGGGRGKGMCHYFTLTSFLRKLLLLFLTIRVMFPAVFYARFRRMHKKRESETRAGYK
jgi:hypothetical protein